MSGYICSSCLLRRASSKRRQLDHVRSVVTMAPTIASLQTTSRPFSVLNRPPPNYPGHIPLTGWERAFLAVGSALTSIRNPHRGDLIAALGEATAQPYFISRLRDVMLSDPTGRRILKERPRITSASIKLDELRALPDGTVGRAYAAWLDREGVTPDTRSETRYVDDEEEAYVMQRYRECHDFSHALTGLPVVREGEVALKAFEFANTLLPMTGLSIAAVVTLKKNERRRFWQVYGPWAWENGVSSKDVICVYWEERLKDSVDNLRAELGISQPPDLRNIRKAERDSKKKASGKRDSQTARI